MSSNRAHPKRTDKKPPVDSTEPAIKKKKLNPPDKHPAPESHAITAATANSAAKSNSPAEANPAASPNSEAKANSQAAAHSAAAISEVKTNPAAETNRSATDEKHFASTILTASAISQITKALLGFGTDNNFPDVQQSEGRSWHAGLFGKRWQYISAKDRLNIYKKPSQKIPKHSKRSFYHIPFEEEPDTQKFNHIARVATGAILARSGSCDEHSFVAAMLLRQFLPNGTTINICHFQSEDNVDFPHSFVVIGKIEDDTSVSGKIKNENLIVVDPWPITGGAVRLKDYIFRNQTNGNYFLKAEATFTADNKDHIIKRVKKQKNLLKKIPENLTLSGFQDPNLKYHKLEDQKDIATKIKAIPLAEISKVDMYTYTTIAEGYKDPPGTAETVKKMLDFFPDLKEEIESVTQDLTKAGVKKRLGTI